MTEQLLLPVERPESARQTLLKYAESCPRSAYLSLKHEGGPGSHAMHRGSIFHEVAERLTKLALETGEVEIGGDVARDYAQQVIAERKDLPIPVHEQEAVRLMAWNWGEATVLDLPNIFGIERKVQLDLSGWLIHGTIDLARWLNWERTEALIEDYKTSLSLPSQEDYAKTFQGQFYALLISQGVYEDTGERVASQLSTVHTRQVYPRYRLSDGTLAVREVSFTQPQLADFAESVKAILGRMDHGFETGEWHAVPGTHCAICPAPQECPIPREHRYIEAITSPAEAAEAAALRDKLDAECKRLYVSMREWAKANGPIYVGKDEVYDFKSVEQRVFNKDKALANVEDPEEYFDKRVATRFVKQKREE